VCRTIQLHYGEGTWEVGFLPRPVGAGLSGGWRTFAIDQVTAEGVPCLPPLSSLLLAAVPPCMYIVCPLHGTDCLDIDVVRPGCVHELSG
jgi:hypothetical protein